MCLGIGANMVEIPKYEIVQRNICRRIHGPDAVNMVSHEGDGGTKDPCKSNEVQTELSSIFGWGVTFELLPGMILSVPFGAVADRYGRSLVLGLALAGVTVCMAVQAVICKSSLTLWRLHSVRE